MYCLSNKNIQTTAKFLFVTLLLIWCIRIAFVQAPNFNTEIDIAQFEYWSRKAEYDSILLYLQPRYEVWKKNGIEEPIAKSFKFYVSASGAKGVENLKDSIEYRISTLDKRTSLPVYINFYYHLLAEQYFREGNWEESKILLESIINSSETEDKYPNLIAESLSMLAYIKSEERNFELSLAYTKKADSLLIANYGIDYAGRIMVLNNYGINYGELGEFEKALEFAMETRKLTQLHYAPNHKNQSISLNNLSVMLSNLGRNDESLQALKEALDINIQQNRNVDIFMNYMNLASPYISKEDYTNALNYLKLAESMINDATTEFDPYRIYLYSTLIAFYVDLKDFDSAYLYLKKALDFGTPYYSDYSFPMATIYTSMGNLEMEKGNYKEAIKSHEKAIEIYSYYYGEESSKVANGKFWIGQILEFLKSYPLAIAEVTESHRMYEKIYGQDHRYTIEAKIILAQLYLKDNDVEKAKRILNDVLDRRNVALGKSARKNLFAYSEMEKDVNLIDALELKINILTQELNEQNKLSILKEIALAYDYIGMEFDRILASYGGYKDRDDLRKNSELLFKKAVAVCYDLYEHTKEKEWAEKAFGYSERARALKIQEIMRDRIATNQSGLPDSVVNKEFELKSHLKSLENQLVETDKSDTLVYRSLNKAYLMVNLEYSEFIRKLEKDFTKYYDLKYNVDLVTPKDVRSKLLNGNNILLQYSIIGSNAYVHVIGVEVFDLVKLDIPTDLDEIVKKWYQGMKSRNFQSLDENGKIIFKEFIEPIYTIIKDKDLIIVPDGALYYINFESLPISHLSDDYMIEHHKIQYCYSPTVQIQSKSYEINSKSNYDWVGFVPGFKDNKSKDQKEFTEQPWAMKAANTIAERFKSKLFSGKEANISSFQTFASEGEILHMGTHAVADDENPLRSYFVLSGEGGDYDLLYANEIFNSEIRSRCAVLTACETGVGKIKAGEGMVSLARAFSYAGCPNIVLTLWPVDDEQTGTLIESFYNYVAEGKNFDEALHEAKMVYLREARGELKHPYYWAGLMYYGSESSINTKTSLKTLALYGIPGIVIIILIGVMTRKRRISSGGLN